MIHIYEKRCKTKFNPYGISELLDENPFENGPCIVTILAYPISLIDINGSLRQVAKIINPDIDNKYDPKRRILGLGFGEYDQSTLKFSKYSPSEEELNDFMIKYFYPLISTNNTKIDIITAMKNIRNVTFVTFCNGAKVFKRIEDRLEQKMYDLGYNNSEVGIVLSQLCHAAISGNVIKKKNTKTLTITFGDALDIEFNNDKNLIKNLDIKNGNFIQYNYSLAYGIVDDGNHSFKKHMTENKILSSKIKKFLNASLENALYNQENDMLSPITYEKIDDSINSFNNDNKTKYK